MPVLDKRLASVYQIINRITLEHYIGSTRSYVGTRWNWHLTRLMVDAHPLREFQKSWNSSKVEDWDFRILETEIPTYLQFDKEIEWQDKLHPTFGKKSYFYRIMKQENIEQVLKQVKEGKTYREIAASQGVALGWISKIVNRYKLIE